jgi:hypothetical protein
VNLGTLRAIATRLKNRHDLARELWGPSWIDARVRRQHHR